MAEEQFDVIVEEFIGEEPAFDPGSVEPLAFELEPLPGEPAPTPTPEPTPPVYFELQPQAVAPTPIIVPNLPFFPALPPPVPVIEKTCILNIETTGTKPWEQRIIAIGFQDVDNIFAPPIVIMHENEAQMIWEFLNLYASGNYKTIVGFNLGFDYRFILLRAMSYNIACNEFAYTKIYDLMEKLVKGEKTFFFRYQTPPTLSDIADFYFGFPKDITDQEMIIAYKEGRLDVVYKFSSEQITRTLALYHLYDFIIKNPVESLPPIFTGSEQISMENPHEILPPGAVSSNPGLGTKLPLTCGNCLAEFISTPGITPTQCTICGTKL